MDSVIVFFGAKTHDEVEGAAKQLGLANGSLQRDDLQFYLHRYLAAEWSAELDAAQQASVERLLGGCIESALQVCCRHGPAERLALATVLSLMTSQGPAVLDDDFGGIWTADDLAKCLVEEPSIGLYDLRRARSPRDAAD